MPEISEQEWAELKQQVANLANQLNQARNRIEELEDFATDHLGLDWGESLVDANSPHPNISVNTIESGGGVIRQDAGGMQVAAPTGTAGAIHFVQHLQSSDPATNATGTLSSLYGFNDGNDPSLVITADHFTNALNATVRAAIGDDGTEAEASLKAEFPGIVSPPEVAAFADSSGGHIKLSGQVRYTADLTPPQITSSQNDYAPTGLGEGFALRLSSDASRDITGLAGGASGRTVVVFNVGANNIVLKDESVASTAANRFALAADITLAPDNSALLWYDSTSSRWRCVARYT